MKLLFTLLIACCFAITLSAQENQPVDEDGKQVDKAFTIVEEMPEFGDHPDDLQKYLSENIKYPKQARKKNIEGMVFVSLVVDKTGKVTQVKLLKGVDPLLDEEALRVIREMPDWKKPGKQRGKAVPVQYNIPINFKLT